MLEHLLTLDPEPLHVAASSFVPLEKATAGEILNGKVSADDWLRSLGSEAPVAADPVKYQSAVMISRPRCVLNTECGYFWNWQEIRFQ